VRGNNLLTWMAVAVCAILACPALHAQSVADAARAAKEKKKKQAESAQAQDASKPKVYTNEDIPEAPAPAPVKSGDSQPAPSKTSGSATKSASDAKTSTPSDQAGLPHGPDSAHVDFKFTASRVKRPGTAETQWMVTNTADHFERVELKTIINGPCGYHREYNGGEAELNSGGGITDNWQADLTVLPTDCLGTYHLELRASVGGKLLGTASDSVTYE
jgi:hypothetical protein